MSIKPMAFIDDAGLYALQHNASAKVWSVPAEKETPLFAIPDTHRVVSVELLNSIMELAGVALVYQPFGTKDRQNFDALMAIIEDKAILATHAAPASQGGER